MAMVTMICWSLVVVVVTGLLLCRLKQVYEMVWKNPIRIRSTLAKQGIGGPTPAFLYGNVKEIQIMESEAREHAKNVQELSHDHWVRAIFPHLRRWTFDYGPVYMFSTGNQQHLYLSQPELIKELKLNKSLDLGKPSYTSKALEPLLGNGIIKANGHEWALQRRLIAPEFFLHKVKGMIGLMEECAMAMVKTWETRLIESQGGVADLMVDQDLRCLSADIISKACFGSSYSQGKNIFSKLRVMQEAMSKPSIIFGLPNLKFLPTKSNREISKLKKEVEELILKVIKERQEESQKDTGKYGKDLLDMILESAATDAELQQSKHNTHRFIVDNCKNIYFAGYESTALAASWTLMLLALYPEWQEHVRTEIFHIWGDKKSLHQTPASIDLDQLRQLKTLTMVIQESLRLYGPSVVAAREVFADIKLGNLTVPKGVNIWSLVPALHRDPENWGADSNEFKPDRFAGGISKACKWPQVYMPFGYGSRLCVGQTFALMELKILLSIFVANFSFSISPNYRHSPVYKMLLMPQHGMRLLVKKV
ncbi:cytochrome P450 714A1-like [Mangifera indica]|uniref:cytochrome P450 714A1-like n=1 Tax=Mangifera indica TaxID=29780 RepID=UPI001CFBD956|nr:cytochrome P450 714A1-like [Mangifera indica]